MPFSLDTSIEYIKGVGPAKAEALKTELGIFTIGDFLSHYPHRHEDRSKIFKVRELSHVGEVNIQLVGKIIPEGLTGVGRGQRFIAEFSDDSGTVELIWFQGAQWIEKYIKPNEKYLVFGKVSNFKGKLSIAHPELEIIGPQFSLSELGLTPVYPMTEGLKRKRIDNRFMAQTTKKIIEDSQYFIPENLPEKIINKYKFPSRSVALKTLHSPKNPQELELVKNRLKFEELFYLQYRHLQLKSHRNRNYKGLIFETVGDFFNNYYQSYLPFELTGAQKRVIREIRSDMKTGLQMNRLLQGDVGSGKTMVALLSTLIALDNGFQACIMAPTEILANQHFESISESLNSLPLKVELLTGSTKKKARNQILEDLKSNKINILIGTHALIEQDVEFFNIGLVVIDEQHRFGVAQRAKLWKKGNVLPHVLVMTATPIPRTLAMTLYGDLDVSVIDELPKGRKPIKTVHQHENNRPLVMDFLKKEIAIGRQVYYVFPLIDDSPKLELKSLMSGYDMVAEYLSPPQFKYSLVHGRLKGEEKESEMNKFKNHNTDIMIATTVIEVGVNVPNASVMVIENAERFGLSQLHQLRGRVGRGAEQSYCILITGSKLSEAAKKRIITMVRSTDGFEIAKVDLELRGPGEIDGTKQSGILDLKLADIRQDESILIAARSEAQDWIEFDELLMKSESIPIKNELSKNPHRTIWSKIS
ncbi:MAG: ATP-dependent DNA helicase RecG [Bacteroidia bacterium]